MNNQSPWRIEILREPGALSALRAEWNDLWLVCPEATEAQSWAWQNLYWQHVARGHRSLVVTARDTAGKLVAAGALEIRRDRASLLTVLGFSGEHDADYHVLLRRPDVPLTAGREMFVELLRATGGEISGAEFLNLPGGSWTAEALRLAVPDLGAFAETGLRRESETYAITLPASMEEYWAGFSKKTRDRLRGKQRKFEREMKPEFRVHADAAHAAEALDDIERVDRSRWGAATKFGDTRQRAFLRGMITELLEAKVARVFTLHAGGRCVAFNVGFLLHGSMKFPYLAHVTDLPGNYSVGLINNLLAIEHCIAQGVREYDLTRGSEGYKSLLGGAARANVRYLFWRDAQRGALAGFNRKFVAPLLRNSFARRIYRAVRGRQQS